MQAYKNDSQLKTDFLAEMTWHREQDKIVQTTYGDTCANGDFRGCFVGCAIHSLAKIQKKKLVTSQHQLLEDLIDIPFSLAHLADAVFESLPKAIEFSIEFPTAIAVGADLSMVVPHFLYWTLTDNVKPTKYPQYRPFIDAVIALYEEWTRTGIRPSSLADLAYRAYLADLADLAYRADRTDLAYRAYLAYLAYRAYLADLAYRADRAYLAYRAYRAYLADLADLADRAAAKVIELVKAAPVSQVAL